MMRKTTKAACIIVLAAALLIGTTVAAADEHPLLGIMVGELTLSMDKLVSPDGVKPYFIQYAVTDTNFPDKNAWQFVVRIPSAAAERLEVRPRTTPKVKVWEELTDRSLTFMKATMPAARGKRYCQVALADASGEKSKDVVRSDERSQLPRWFDQLAHRLRAKEAVRSTKGTDGRLLVDAVRTRDPSS